MTPTTLYRSTEYTAGSLPQTIRGTLKHRRLPITLETIVRYLMGSTSTALPTLEHHSMLRVSSPTINPTLQSIGLGVFITPRRLKHLAFATSMTLSLPYSNSYFTTHAYCTLILMFIMAMVSSKLFGPPTVS